MKTLVLGLGNPILCDDGVGLRVAAQLKAGVALPDVTILETESEGVNLLELLAGYDRAIIVDAIQTPRGKPGQIHRLGVRALHGTRHTSSTHGIDFATLLELGKKVNLTLPEKIIIFGIEVKDASTFGEKCSPSVEQAIPACVAKIKRLLKVKSLPPGSLS
jgi:hydrogenase maturation protease